MSAEPIQGRILPPDEPLPPRLQRPWFRTAPRPDTAPPDTAPTPPAGATPGYTPPPDIVHVHVTVVPGTDLSPVEDAGRPWWRPAWTLRTAMLGAIGLMPIPGIGAPSGRWALQLSDIAGEQSMGAAWVIAAAAIGGALANDRRAARRPGRWDDEERSYRPGWLARAILCAAISGAALTLPVLDTYVALTTGVRP